MKTVDVYNTINNTNLNKRIELNGIKKCQLRKRDYIYRSMHGKTDCKLMKHKRTNTKYY